MLAGTLKPPPAELGVTQWPSRLLARQEGVHHATVARMWREYALKPYRLEMLEFSTDRCLPVHGLSCVRT
jgi:hypothetical protein